MRQLALYLAAVLVGAVLALIVLQRYGSAALPPPASFRGACGETRAIRLRDVTSLFFAVNRTACTERPGADGKHTRWQMQPNTDSIAREVQCTQQGWDGTHTHWRCEAQPTSHVNVPGFGDTMYIVCEGWNGASDEWIRPGSCSLHWDTVLRMTQAAAKPPLIVGFAVGLVQ